MLARSSLIQSHLRQLGYCFCRRRCTHGGDARSHLTSLHHRQYQWREFHT